MVVLGCNSTPRLSHDNFVLKCTLPLALIAEVACTCGAMSQWGMSSQKTVNCPIRIMSRQGGPESFIIYSDVLQQ
ncbi:hypothetical protein H5410_044132 [Solanum commersonii]|uniref:Uncharacterized protein n=1 Tax=Solanum commersonii TaxID=4109 RepID=A0A9J5X757_SOLCO|nr:hypothetical protein H5410_044132 [Solanum commersonii]